MKTFTIGKKFNKQIGLRYADSFFQQHLFKWRFTLNSAAFYSRCVKCCTSNMNLISMRYWSSTVQQISCGVSSLLIRHQRHWCSMFDSLGCLDGSLWLSKLMMILSKHRTANILNSSDSANSPNLELVRKRNPKETQK